MHISSFPIRSIGERTQNLASRSQWPNTMPRSAISCKKGLEPGAATILVGENSSGKSTLVEAIALS